MTPRAFLVADCGGGVGLGHLERMLALADALRSTMEVRVVIPQGDTALRRRVADRGHAPQEIPGDTPQRAEAAVGAAFRDVVPDVVVLDGYVFAAALQRRLRAHARLTVVDDLGLPTDCDLAVNPSPGGDAMHPIGADTFLGGATYALLRASFLEARELVAGRGRPLRSVLVSTGATDPGGIGAAITAELLSADPTVEVLRIVGPDTDARADRPLPREHRLVAPPSLAEALSRATLYAGAAGTTAVQAACVGIPAVITAAVSNQTTQAAALAEAGCALVTDAHGLARACLQLLDDPARCDAMAAHGRALVDGQGAARVAEAVRNLAAARAA
jgi:UDP-2,4-diacetamido-2,4,6-trideoxy-beta-L-altropyranose hydrolase